MVSLEKPDHYIPSIDVPLRELPNIPDNHNLSWHGIRENARLKNKNNTKLGYRQKYSIFVRVNGASIIWNWAHRAIRAETSDKTKSLPKIS
jgi:hypothetical protein